MIRLLALGSFFCAMVMLGAGDSSAYSQWLELNGEHVDANSFPSVSSETPRVVRTNVLKAIRWALGETMATNTVLPSLNQSHAGTGAITFPNGVIGELQFPAAADGPADKVPLVICLSLSDEKPALIDALMHDGFAVMTFDQIGNGTRKKELNGFYARHPHWSLLGKMVDDTQAAITAAVALPSVDTNRVWLLGHGSGSTIALHAAAIDARVRGVLAVGGFAPMRPSLANRGVPTFAQQQRSFPLLPKFGAFIGHEDRIPYDFRELVDVIAPRRVLLFASSREKGMDAKDLARLYAPMKHVKYQVVDNTDHFEGEAKQTVLDELKRAITETAP